jgi:replication-associated recombination protein RarA
MVVSFDHLHPAYRHLAGLPDDERVEWIRADRWVNFAMAERALRRLEDLLTYPRRDRMPCMLIYGDTGIGKTKIIAKFVRDHPPAFDHGTGIARAPVVAFQMPAQPDEDQFYDELFRALGAPSRSGERMAGTRHHCRGLLRAMGTRMLVIDEVHAMFAGTYRQQRIFLNTIRFLANDLRMPLVCAGTDEARQAILTDTQLAERCDALELPRWRDDEALRWLLASFAAILPLRRASAFDSAALRKRVLAMTDGVTNRIFRLIEVVAAKAIKNGSERIDVSRLEADDLVLPLVSMTRGMHRSLGRRAA